MLRPALRFAPLLIVPLISGGFLASQVRTGPGGKVFEKQGKDYWRKNLATWREVETAAVRHLDLKVSLDPESRAFGSTGTYELVNHLEHPLRQLPFTDHPAFR